MFLLSGGQRQHHGYREQALYLSGALENTGRFQVTIGEDAAILETPAIRKYDLLIVTADRRDPEFKFTPGQQEAIFDFVRSGHGYVSIHGADNAPQDWLPPWKEMLGGIYSHFGKPDGKARKGTFTVKIADTASPVTQGLKDFTLKDELYTNMQMQPDVQPLATIEYQGVVWPVAWTNTFGKGRVFHTSLGHRDFGPDKDDPLRDPNLEQADHPGNRMGRGRTKSRRKVPNPRLEASVMQFEPAGIGPRTEKHVDLFPRMDQP